MGKGPATIDGYQKVQEIETCSSNMSLLKIINVTHFACKLLLTARKKSAFSSPNYEVTSRSKDCRYILLWISHVTLYQMVGWTRVPS